MFHMRENKSSLMTMITPIQCPTKEEDDEVSFVSILKSHFCLVCF